MAVRMFIVTWFVCSNQQERSKQQIMDQNRIHLKLDASAAASVDAYWEYRKIVGEDDGGQLFTPEEYERYKKNVLPQRLKNRLYVSWTNPDGLDCKLVGPETPCFCDHRYKQHRTDYKELPETRPVPVPCRVNGCKCRSFDYVPKNGSQPIRCQCKHYTDDHSECKPHRCLKDCKCKAFRSSFTCGCSYPTYAHKTIIETKEERQTRGHPVGEDVPYAAMGGITGFSSLMEGYMRLDDSGIGPPSKEFLEQPIGPHDHAFLKAHAGMAELSLEDQKDGMIAGQTKEEQDMAWFEKRYQERRKAEREWSRLKQTPSKKLSAMEGSPGASRQSPRSPGTSPRGSANHSRGAQRGRP